MNEESIKRRDREVSAPTLRQAQDRFSISISRLYLNVLRASVVNSYHLLTASHDADKLVPPLTIDASTGRETLHMMNGERKQIKAGDMMRLLEQGLLEYLNQS